MNLDFRGLAQQARLAVGSRGVTAMVAAGLLALICCTITVADLALSLRSTDVASGRQAAVEIEGLDDAIRQVVRNGLTMASGYIGQLEGRSPMQESWNRFRSTLDLLCGQTNQQPAARFAQFQHICQTRADLYRTVTPEIEAFNPPSHTIDRRVGLQLLGLREEIADLRQLTETEAGRLVVLMGRHYRLALWVLAASTAGLLGAGAVLLVLFAAVSTKHHAQWCKTRKARDLLRETIEALPAGVILFDRNERLIMFNDAAKASAPLLLRPDIMGISYEELAHETARLAREFGHPLFATPEEWIARFRSKGELRMRQPVGERWFEWSERATPSGRTVGLRVDITDLKENEIELEAGRRRLEEETSRLTSIIESSGAIICLIDRDLRYAMVNREFTNVLGFTAQQAVGRTVAEILGELHLDRTQLDKWLAAPLPPDHGETMRYTRPVHDLQGRQRTFNVTARPVVDRFGMTRQIVVVGVDVTDQREAEQALADAERLATVGEMAATVAHEISQPLQAINIACSSAVMELGDSANRGTAPDSGYLTQRLERIAQQIERAHRIVNDLRSFVRSTSRDAPAPFDPAEAIRDAIDLTAATLRDARVALSSQIAQGLPKVTGHFSRLSQVLVNLVNNARDAGGRAIAITAEPAQLSGKPALRIWVDDSGPGIAPEVLSRLFVNFVTTKERGKGTGLGLRICRRIIEEMNGTISAANRPEGGARFEILIPASDA